MNHGVWTSRQLHRLHPHKGFPGWEREVNGWRGPDRHETMTGNMAGIGLPWNGSPGLHVWLVRDACDQFSSPKDTLQIFSILVFMAVSNTSSSFLHLKHGALRSRYMSLRIGRQFFNTKNAWCGSISSRFSVMLPSILVFASRCSGVESRCRGDPSNCHRLEPGIEMDGNSFWKHLIFSDRPWLVVLLTMSNSHLELFISRPTEDGPFLMMAALLSTFCGLPPIHPSSSYQTFRSDLTSDVTLWMVRAKRAGPRGSPCCTPVAASRRKSPWKRDVFEE